MQHKRLLYILGLSVSFLIVASLSVQARLFPLKEFVSDESQEKASLLVMSRLMSTVHQKTTDKYSQLSAPQKKQAANFMLNTILSKEKDKAQEAIHSLAKTLDKTASKQTPGGYLKGSDSFYYLGLTQSILESGQIGSDIKGSKYLNPLMLYPDGHWEPLTLHPFLGAGVHTILKLFNASQPLMASVSWLPVILIVLSIMAFFLGIAVLKYPWPSALGAASCIFFAPILLERSFYGWYDNDPYNILFPLLILFALFLMDNQCESKRKKILLGIFCGLCIAAYALFWQGWVLIAAIVFASIILTAILLAFKKSINRNDLLPYTALILSAGLGIILAFGAKDLFVLFQEGWVALKNFVSPKFSLWPDLYIAVGELRASSFSQIIEFLGGWIPFALAIAGILINAKKLFSKEGCKNSLSILAIVLYFCFTFYLSLGARRFILLSLAPMGFLIASGITFLASLISSLINKIFHKLKSLPILHNGILFLIALAVCINAVVRHYPKTSSLFQNRIYTDTWNDAMTYLRKETPPASVINTWWSPGHFITSMGKRAVVFDGATINYNDHAYWLACALMTSDENLAAGILRMLNNSGTHAIDFLIQQGLPLSESVSLLKTILKLPQKDAAKILQQHLSNPAALKKTLALTHPDSPVPSYILVYNEIIEKSILLPFVANWDIKRAEKIRNNTHLQKQLPPSNTKDYVDFLWNMSGGMPRFSGVLKPNDTSKTVLDFGDGIHIDTQHLTCRVSSKTYGEGIPKFFIFSDQNGQIIKKALPDATLNYTVIFGIRNNRPICALMDHSLADSLLMRLYFFQHAKTNHFEHVFSTENLTKRTEIDLFKIHF